MSKFFRSLSSSSSSAEDEEGKTQEPTSSATSDVGEVELNSFSTAINALSLRDGRVPHGLTQEDILHALLEERCINQVVSEQSHHRRGARQHDAHVQAEARARYQRLCSVLAPHMLISSGLEREWQSQTRRQIRYGLDLYARTSPTSQLQQRSPPSLRKLLTDSKGPSAPSRDLRLTKRLRSPGAEFFDSIDSAHPLLESSRYLREFEEVGILGQGGYGTVYHVKHKLDHQAYAIKKVPISTARMARIRSRGQRELDELLLELCTLAQLDHPNVVRYFGGWIDWFDGRTAAPAPDSSSGLQIHPELDQSPYHSLSRAKHGQSTSLKKVVTQSDSPETEIIFEESDSGTRQDNVLEPSVTQQESVMSETGDDLTLDTGLTLALHIQMGLYPLTLADFISPQISSVTPLGHCFHLEPTIDILLAIFEGVEYLHNQGFVHRDLKPANIFLGASSTPRATPGSVDLFSCSACQSNGTANPVNLSVRIGDFGLVTEIAQPDAHNRTGTPVGTESYRPITVLSNQMSPSLDIFAIGIIAFELLWRFSTQMERRDTLQQLKDGVFPLRFSERIADNTGQMQRCITDMLLPEKRVMIGSLKGWLSSIRDSHG